MTIRPGDFEVRVRHYGAVALYDGYVRSEDLGSVVEMMLRQLAGRSAVLYPDRPGCLRVEDSGAVASVLYAAVDPKSVTDGTEWYRVYSLTVDGDTAIGEPNLDGMRSAGLDLLAADYDDYLAQRERGMS